MSPYLSPECNKAHPKQINLRECSDMDNCTCDCHKKMKELR